MANFHFCLRFLSGCTLLIIAACLLVGISGERCWAADLHVRLVDPSGNPVTTTVDFTLITRLDGSVHRAHGLNGEAAFTGLAPGFYDLEIVGGNIRGVFSQSVELRAGEMSRTVLAYVSNQKTARPAGGGVDVSQLQVPASAKRQLDKGVALLGKDELEKARSHFLQAAELDPEYADAYNDLGVIAARQGNREEARAEFTRALAIDPHHPEACNNLMRIAYLDRDWPGVERFAQRSLSVHADDPETLTHLASAELSLRKYPEALAFAQRAHALAPLLFSEGHIVAARALRALGRNQEAEGEYRRFLDEAPRSPVASAIQDEMKSLPQSRGVATVPAARDAPRGVPRLSPLTGSGDGRH